MRSRVFFGRCPLELWKFLSIPFLIVFTHDWILKFVKCFFSWDKHVLFILYWYISDFCILNQICIPVGYQLDLDISSMRCIIGFTLLALLLRVLCLCSRGIWICNFLSLCSTWSSRSQSQKKSVPFFSFCQCLCKSEIISSLNAWQKLH